MELNPSFKYKKKALLNCQVNVKQYFFKLRSLKVLSTTGNSFVAQNLSQLHLKRTELQYSSDFLEVTFLEYPPIVKKKNVNTGCGP